MHLESPLNHNSSDLELIDVAKLSQVIGLSEYTLKKLARLGIVPAMNINGRKWLFNLPRVSMALEKRYNKLSAMSSDSN